MIYGSPVPKPHGELDVVFHNQLLYVVVRSETPQKVQKTWLPPFQRTHFKGDHLGSHILDNPLDLYDFLQLRSAKSLYDPNN